MKKDNKVIQDKFKVFMMLTIAYAVFIFYLSSLSSPPSPSDLGFLRGFLRESIQLLEDLGLKFLIYPFYLAYLYPDKFEHLVLYMFFGLLLHLTLRNSKNFSKYACSFSVLIGTLYGISDEIHRNSPVFRSFPQSECHRFARRLFGINSRSIPLFFLLSSQKILDVG